MQLKEPYNNIQWMLHEITTNTVIKYKLHFGKKNVGGSKSIKQQDA